MTVGYGHIGDGDLHINVSYPGFENKDLMDRLNNLVYPHVMDFVRQRKGSVGAEHGMGVLNPPYLSYSKSD